MIELNIREEERTSHEFRDRIYIDLTSADDDERKSGKRQLVKDESESESESDQSSLTESSSGNASDVSVVNHQGIRIIICYNVLMNSGRCILTSG